MRARAGGRFTAADPSVIEEMPEPYERFRDSLRGRRGYRWVQEIFARHRHAASGPAAPAEARGSASAVSG